MTAEKVAGFLVNKDVFNALRLTAVCYDTLKYIFPIVLPQKVSLVGLPEIHACRYVDSTKKSIDSFEYSLLHAAILGRHLRAG